MEQKTKTRWYIWVGAGLLTVALLLTVPVMLPHTGEDTPSSETSQSTASTVQSTLPEPSVNVFSPMDFAYAGDYLTCTTDKSILGLDVSTHQKEIDWEQVKAAGFEFVMIRLAYRGSIEGQLSADEWAQTYYRGAREAGLKVGGYIFTQAITVEEAIADAAYVLETVKDWEVQMPLVYDWEVIDESYRNGNVDARLLTDMSKAFCETVEAAGYDAMVYFNPSQSRKQMYLEELTDYGFWLAMYSDEMSYEYKVDMWQYTCEGSVPGISGNVDINLYFPYGE